MAFFLLLVLKLSSLYLIMALGFLAGKLWRVKRDPVAHILIYAITPIVVLKAGFSAELSASYLLLPIIFFIICCAMCLLTLRITKSVWNDDTRYILAFTAGSANTGYFGLPVAVALLGKQALAPMVLGSFGLLLYESTLGYYVTARGRFTVKESIRRLVSLPAFYAVAAGLIFNALGFKTNPWIEDIGDKFLGAYVVLGMMLIGLSIAELENRALDLKFIGISFFNKFVVWPLIVQLILLFDRNIFHFFNSELQTVMTLISIVPLAANTVAYAADLGVQPGKAAVAVFLSTLVALFYIPIVASVFW